MHKLNRRGMADTRTIEEFVVDTVAQLVPVTNVHSRRALLYKVSEDIAKRDSLVDRYQTTAAISANTSGQRRHPEHVVPRGVITNHLLGRPEDATTPIPRRSVERAIQLFQLICWVSAEEEQFLNKNYDGWDAAHCMPPGWDFDADDPWARYEQVKRLEPRMSQWQKVVN